MSFAFAQTKEDHGAVLWKHLFSALNDIAVIHITLFRYDELTPVEFVWSCMNGDVDAQRNDHLGKHWAANVWWRVWLLALLRTR